MTLREQKCQGTPGADLTTGNTSGSGSTAYSLINAPTTGALVFSDDVANPCHGGTVARFDGTLGSAAEARWTTADVTAATQQVVIQFTGKPAAGGGVLDWLYNRGTIRNNHVRLMETSDGRMRLYRRDSSTTGEVTSATLTSLLNVWLVVDLVTAQGTTTTNGTMRFRVRRLDDLTTNVSELNVSDADVGQIGTHVMNMFQLGKTSGSSGNVAPFYVAHHALDDGATDYLPDPPLFEASTPDQALITRDGTFIPAQPVITRGGAWEPLTLA